LLGAKRREVRRLGRRLNMAAPFVFTIHRLVRDQPFERGKRLQGGLEEQASTLLADPLDQCQRIKSQASQYLATIAGAGAPADPFTFQDHDIRASTCKLAGGGETRVACPDDHDVGASGNWCGMSAVFEGSTSLRNRFWTVPPIGVLLHIVPQDVQRPMFSMIASPNWVVLTSVAPVISRAKSYVTRRLAIAPSMPSTIRSAASVQPM
jgi:hypothetical protein